MTTEDKARAYDEALERAKEYYDADEDNTMQVHARGVMEYLFPKLKENEDERIRNLLYCLIRDGIYSEKLLKYNGVSVDMVLAWLEKQGEQKPAWSEEDEKILGKCIEAASGYYSPEDKQSMKDWLRQLKGRIISQLQPKQEWSEEDENCLYMAIECVKTCGYPSVANWLKSLRPQPKQDHFE